ncbi:MAG: histidinol-phosphatase [Planctomycetes bacterium]|nr:histidinol-phosphatase [Planctomycetota bacterium]
MRADWRVSFHGGHSGEFCAHARGTLEEVVRAAIAAGLSHLGVSEHAPRVREIDLYPDETLHGIGVADLLDKFSRYARERFPELAARYGDRIALLKGMETEVVPHEDYAPRMQAFRREFEIEYLVGSVHHVRNVSIDSSRTEWIRAAQEAHGAERLVLDYYRAQREMLDLLRPEVVAHFDLIKLFAPRDLPEGAAVRRAIDESLAAVLRAGSLLEVNGKAWAKGLSEPYPSIEILSRAREMGIPATFGDDSHAPEEVGRNLDRCRAALLAAGFSEVHALVRGTNGLERRAIPLGAAS